MMMMIRLVVAFVLATGLAAPAMAQDPGTQNMEILRQKLKADRKLVIAQNLGLTDAEGAHSGPSTMRTRRTCSRSISVWPR